MSTFEEALSGLPPGRRLHRVLQTSALVLLLAVPAAAQPPPAAAPPPPAAAQPPPSRVAPARPGSTTSPPRVEKDLLGPMTIPGDAYYGVQTARALDNFPISGVLINHYP